MNDEINWWPTAQLATLQQRAVLLKQIRTFFEERQVLEVETPVFTHSGSTEVHLDQFITQADAAGRCYTLNTSPELAMKRLLAAGYGDIYQISKVFRANETGQYHEPEFTMLEWYRINFSMADLMTETEGLLQQLIPAYCSQTAIHLTYQQAFAEYLAVDPFDTSISELQQVFAKRRGHMAPALNDKQAYLDLLMSTCVETEFDRGRLTFVRHYPAEQASLARINAQDPRLAERFEVFAGGLELGNGFHELSDVEQQKHRMTEENQRRRENGKPEVKPDHLFCAALQHGLPDCSGIAMGFDRIMMLATGRDSIQDVKSFSTSNA